MSFSWLRIVFLAFESSWVRSEQDTLIQDGETYAVDGTTSEEGLGFSEDNLGSKGRMAN